MSTVNVNDTTTRSVSNAFERYIIPVGFTYPDAPEFGLEPIYESFEFGAETGDFNLSEIEQASQRSFDCCAGAFKPNYPVSMHAAFSARVYFEYVSGLTDPNFDRPGVKIDASVEQYVAGIEHIAAELAVMVGNMPVQSDGDIFLKYYLCNLWCEGGPTPAARVVRKALDARLATDCASIGVDFDKFMNRAIKRYMLLTGYEYEDLPEELQKDLEVTV